MIVAKETVTMITTIDNPFDPFEDFAKWFVFDSMQGYNTCGLLSIKAQTSDLYSEDENKFIIEDAIDSMIENDLLHIYKKVTKEVEVEE